MQRKNPQEAAWLMFKGQKITANYIRNFDIL